MKYKIVVEKSNENFYLAYCPIIPDIQVCGATAASALDKLQEELLCYLHDPKAELEIVYRQEDVQPQAAYIHAYKRNENV